MLKKEDLVKIVQSAFRPLECVAELQNYDHAFGFAVYLPDESRITREFENASSLCQGGYLEAVINEVRNKVTEKSIHLDSWSFPRA